MGSGQESPPVRIAEYAVTGGSRFSRLSGLPVDDAVLHDEIDLLEQRNIRERIAGYRDDVGIFAGLNRADPVFPAEQGGSLDGCPLRQSPGPPAPFGRPRPAGVRSAGRGRHQPPRPGRTQLGWIRMRAQDRSATATGESSHSWAGSLTKRRSRATAPRLACTDRDAACPSRPVVFEHDHGRPGYRHQGGYRIPALRLPPIIRQMDGCLRQPGYLP
jgi:hypothetical protein